MIKSRIFLKSTRKGLLKNVNDGVSRPLGGREIQKRKVGTVLPDTLYLDKYTVKNFRRKFFYRQELH